MGNNRSTTALSVRGGKPYVQAIRALAEKRGTSIGEMVRQALDAQLGAELERFVIFFTQDGTEIFHSEHVKSKEPLESKVQS